MVPSKESVSIHLVKLTLAHAFLNPASLQTYSYYKITCPTAFWGQGEKRAESTLCLSHHEPTPEAPEGPQYSNPGPLSLTYSAMKPICTL